MGKIINDPVYGFIKFPEKEMMQIIDHPWFQRLRGIRQMGMAHLVYPGAVHTRFHHSLGAAHLMDVALNELKSKHIEILPEEVLAARQSILLHDIGHGPFSHALEHTLSEGVKHEEISALIIRKLNEYFSKDLEMSISIFENKYPKFFLHQLVSSQLDMDRMDYLNRDSFFTGVSEGVIGYDRIIQMLNVKDGRLVVEEKGIHSVEKFIIARRLMYWQVYLHKAVLGGEQLIINILKRAKTLASKGTKLFATPELTYFLYENISKRDFISSEKTLNLFCRMDDSDIITAIKVWTNHADSVLSKLCTMLFERKLYRVKLSTQPLDNEYERLKEDYLKQGGDEEFMSYYVFRGETSNNAYNKLDDKINILMKSGSISNISEVDNALIGQELVTPVKKFYVCSLK